MTLLDKALKALPLNVKRSTDTELGFIDELNDAKKRSSLTTDAKSPDTKKPAAPVMLDIDKAAATLIKNTKGRIKSIKRCAEYVRLAIKAGGIELDQVNDAKDYGRSLLKAGYTIVAVFKKDGDNNGEFPKGYVSSKADVAIIQSCSRKHKSGHMTMHDGEGWDSDFIQKDMWGGPDNRLLKPDYIIYRPPQGQAQIASR